MEQTPSAHEVRSFSYMIIDGAEPAMNHPIGRLHIQEVKSAMSRHGLIEAKPDYGFRLVDDTGKPVAEVAPGYYPFFLKVIEAAAPLHSPACAEDCHSDIGAIGVVTGDY